MKQWTEFLVEDSLIPAEQLSTVRLCWHTRQPDRSRHQGYHCYRAMGRIADMLGHSKDAKSYANISSSYIKLWQDYAISHDASHTKLAYQDDASWGTLYNLLADRLLDLNLVPHAVYKIQDAWYPRVQRSTVYRSTRGTSGQRRIGRCSLRLPRMIRYAEALFIDLLYKFIDDDKTDARLRI